MDETGELDIAFSRPVILPDFLVKPYDEDYIEMVPVFPSQDDLVQIYKEAEKRF